MKISVLGCGWLGLPLSETLRQQGNVVKGSTTTPEKLDLLRNSGIEPFLIQLPFRENIPKQFFDSDILIVNIPPRRKAGLTDEYLSNLRQLRELLLDTSLRKIIFVSSTSVYPDLNRVVTEDDASPDSYACQAEEILSSSPFQTTVLRFGGLYGPGRNPANFFAGKENVAGPDSPVNMIHLEDCVGIISTILKKNMWNRVFNACADQHPARKDFYTTMSLRAGVTPPKFSDVPKDWKIVSSEKLKAESGYLFQVPDPMA